MIQNNKRGARRGTSKRSAQRRNAEPMPVVPRIATGNRTMFGFPPRLLTKLRYADTFNVTSLSGSLAKWVLSMNGIYDPDITGTGHQPLYYDTYASIYNHYSVVSSKLTVSFANMYASTAAEVGVILNDDSTATSSYSTIREQNTGKSVLLAPLSGGLSVKTLTLNFDCKRDLGIDPYTSEAYKTPVGQNASEDSDGIIWAAPADTTSSGTVQAIVMIEYLVLFSELTTPTGS